MSRLIDADALKDHIKIFDIGCGCSEDYQKSFLNAIDEQPTIEPEPCEDAVSRQVAIDALMAEPLKWDDSSVWESARCHQWMMDMDMIKALPSAQPEIVRCKNCKYCEHWYADKGRCFLWCESGIDVFEDGFCNYAERRTNA